MKYYLLLWIFVSLFLASCSNESPDINQNSVFDCFLEDDEFIGVCLNGSTIASPNETLRYASKATSNFDDISWTIENGGIEILDVEIEVTPDYILSIATLYFQQNFTE